MNGDIEQDTLNKERRRHPRFPARERALVAISDDNFSLPYHLIDIGEGGMAFRYLNKSPLPLSNNQMDIYMEKDLHVGRLPVTVVNDQKLSGGSIPIRRCSVCFGKMTSAQEIQLKAFIRSHTRTVQSSS